MYTNLRQPTTHGMTSNQQNCVTILHFNDVYNVEGQRQEPVGGAARFVTALRKFRGPNTLTLFSGDAFNPSIVSTITQGLHIPPLLNLMAIDCAVFGNHDFDCGVDILEKCVKRTTFPWLNSNVYDRETNELFANGEEFIILDKGGVKFGLIGLIEEEWVATLSCVDSSEVEVHDFCETGRQLAISLRDSHRCNYVIALTHMRWPNDIKLAQEVPEIDLILGGHDHNYGIENIAGHYVIKSGTDYREFSKIDLIFDSRTNKLLDLTVNAVKVDSSWEPDPEAQILVSDCMESMDTKMDLELGILEVDLDARFSKIRAEETNCGNLICDTMLTAVAADVALLNSGTLRADCIIPAGPFTLRDLHNLLPMLDSVVMLEVTGSQLLEALENGVSQFPRLEGRFPQVAGVKFAFSPQKTPGQRISASDVEVQNQPLVPDQLYKLCTKSYLALGKDGYDVFAKCRVLIDEENGAILSTLVRNHFRAVQVLNGFAKCRTRHRQSVVAIVHRRTLAQKIETNDSANSMDRWRKARKVIIEDERRYCQIRPAVEGRIRCL